MKFVHDNMLYYNIRIVCYIGQISRLLLIDPKHYRSFIKQVSVAQLVSASDC